MSDINISLLAMYNQMLRDPDSHTFLSADVFILPASFTNDDRYHLSQLILSETAEMEPVYPDADTMSTVVKAWSTARFPAWERILTALNEEYNPIHNYDRTEVETGSDTGTRATADTGTVTDADTGTVQDTADSTVTAQTTGFNSASFADDKKTISQGTSGSTRNLQLQRTNNLTQTETRNLANTRNLHVFGNIGVTTSAQMISGEIDIRKLDIYRIIADEFERYFCLLVY